MKTYSGEVRYISTYIWVSGSDASVTDPYHFLSDHLLGSSSYEDSIYKDYGQ